jgi:hypothetical protein
MMDDILYLMFQTCIHSTLIQHGNYSLGGTIKQTRKFHSKYLSQIYSILLDWAKQWSMHNIIFALTFTCVYYKFDIY